MWGRMEIGGTGAGAAWTKPRIARATGRENFIGVGGVNMASCVRGSSGEERCLSGLSRCVCVRKLVREKTIQQGGGGPGSFISRDTKDTVPNNSQDHKDNVGIRNLASGEARQDADGYMKPVAAASQRGYLWNTLHMDANISS